MSIIRLVSVNPHPTPRQEAADRIMADQSRALAKCDWHARAAFSELDKETPNIEVARNFIRRIIATTTGVT